jgi:hypothetical protein
VPFGRRGGKTRAVAVLAAYLAACVDHRDSLAPGERGVIPLLAASVQQAANAFAFVEGVFAVAPNLKDLVDGATSDTLSLTTGIDISVRPASFRTIRGITAVAAICDEIAFWRSDDSANPDKEILKALRPSLATTGGPLIAISSPHAKRGELYGTFKRHFGPTGHPLVLVAKAPSRTMNPTLPQRVIDRATEEDPEAASAEYGAEFRSDLEAYVSREVVEACVDPGRRESQPAPSVRYVGALDAAGGSGQDSMTACIGHVERGGTIIIDAMREYRPQFSPEQVTGELAGFFKSYNVRKVTSDKWGGEWTIEAFRRVGVEVEPAARAKSELYVDMLAPLNSGNLRLPDVPRLINQICWLERRNTRGKGSIDAPQGQHEDLANACAIVVAGFATARRMPNWSALADKMEAVGPYTASPWDADRAPLNVTLTPNGFGRF